MAAEIARDWPTRGRKKRELRRKKRGPTIVNAPEVAYHCASHFRDKTRMKARVRGRRCKEEKKKRGGNNSRLS